MSVPDFKPNVDGASSLKRVDMPLGDDVEALFCVALLNTLDIRQTDAVLKKYLALRDDAENVLRALGRQHIAKLKSSTGDAAPQRD